MKTMNINLYVVEIPECLKCGDSLAGTVMSFHCVECCDITIAMRDVELKLDLQDGSLNVT